MDVLASGETLVLLSGADTEGVSTEVVTLGLDKVGGEGLGAVAVEEGESGTEGRDGDTPERSLGVDATPSGLGVGDGLGEEGAQEQVLQVGLLTVGRGDVGKEDRLDDAATAPHGSDTGVVEGPVVVNGGLAHEHEALGVRDDLGGVKTLLEVVNELLLVAVEGLTLGGGDDLAGADTLLLEGRQATSEDGLADQGDGHALVQGIDGGPLSGTLLAGGVEDLLDNGGSVVVVLAENVTSDLDQERVEDTVLPLGEDVGNLLLVETETSLKDVVGLGDELHISVLDTVVDHLDVVAGTSLTNPVAAWLTLSLSGGLLEDLLDVGPSGVGTTGHERRAVTGTLLTTRDTGADEEKALGLELLGAADRVGVVRVTTVDDDVALLEVGLELANEVVDGLTGLDEEDDTPGALEVGAELLNRVGTNDVGAWCERVLLCSGKGTNPWPRGS